MAGANTMATTVNRLWKNAGVARETMKKAGRSMTKAMIQRGAGGAIIGGSISSLTGGDFSDGAVAGAVIGAGSTAYKMAGLGKNIFKEGTTTISSKAYKGFRAASVASKGQWGKYFEKGVMSVDDIWNSHKASKELLSIYGKAGNQSWYHTAKKAGKGGKRVRKKVEGDELKRLVGQKKKNPNINLKQGFDKTKLSTEDAKRVTELLKTIKEANKLS